MRYRFRCHGSAFSFLKLFSSILADVLHEIENPFEPTVRIWLHSLGIKVWAFDTMPILPPLPKYQKCRYDTLFQVNKLNEGLIEPIPSKSHDAHRCENILTKPQLVMLSTLTPISLVGFTKIIGGSCVVG